MFRNLLPTGAHGDLFLPTDSSMMGSGMGPMTMPDPVDQKTVDDAIRNPDVHPGSQGRDTASRTTGPPCTCTVAPPRGSATAPRTSGSPRPARPPWPQGVSVKNVPDMKDGTGATVCDAKDDGCQTFFYTNQQSARLMFYHDHAWGITRLNVYAGEAAGYLIADDTEKKLVSRRDHPRRSRHAATHHPGQDLRAR